MATKIVEHDLSGKLRDLTGLGSYSHVLVLLRWRGRVLGQMRLDVDNGTVAALSILFRPDWGRMSLEEYLPCS